MERMIFRQEGKIGYLTLNRPDKYNAFDKEMLEEFEAFIQARMYDNSISVINFSSAFGFICSLMDSRDLR